MAHGEAAIAAAIANAIKASGVVVRVEAEDFAKILRKIEKPLVIYTQGHLLDEPSVFDELQRFRFLHQITRADRSAPGS